MNYVISTCICKHYPCMEDKFMSAYVIILIQSRRVCCYDSLEQSTCLHTFRGGSGGGGGGGVEGLLSNP